METRPASSSPSGPRCRSCGAPIQWAKTPSGKMMPVNRAQATDGNLNVIRTSDGLTVQPAEKGTGNAVSHYATCPNATQHRRGAK